MSDAIEKAESGDPGSLRSMMQLAKALSQAGDMVPRHLRGNPGGVLAVMLTGRELGIGTMSAMRSLHLVEGKVQIDYAMLVGLVRERGYGVTWSDCTSETATVTLTAPNGDKHVETWDKARAQTAKLWGRKGPWSTYPETMLKARAVSSAVRAFVGSHFSGVYVEHELDIPDAEYAEAPADPVHQLPPPEVHPLVLEARDIATAEDAPERLRAWWTANALALNKLGRADKVAAFQVAQGVWGKAATDEVMAAKDVATQAAKDEDETDPVFEVEGTTKEVA